MGKPQLQTGLTKEPKSKDLLASYQVASQWQLINTMLMLCAGTQLRWESDLACRVLDTYSSITHIKVINTYDHSTQKMEAHGSEIQGHP